MSKPYSMAKEIASQLNLKDKEQKKKKKEKSVEEKEEKRRKKEAQLGAVVPFWALREFDEASFAAAERFLQTCFAWLTENKSHELGEVFRRPASEKRVEKLIKRANKGELSKIGKDQEVDVVAALVRRFFKDMRSPLLTYELYDTFIGAQGFQGLEKLANIAQAVALLPEHNRRLLELLIRYLHQVSKCSWLNKMSADKLAIVFAPALLRAKRETQLVILSDAGPVTAIIKVLIEKPEDFFPKTPSPSASEAQRREFRRSMSQRYLEHQEQASALIAVKANHSKLNEAQKSKRLSFISESIKGGHFRTLSVLLAAEEKKDMSGRGGKENDLDAISFQSFDESEADKGSSSPSSDSNSTKIVNSNSTTNSKVGKVLESGEGDAKRASLRLQPKSSNRSLLRKVTLSNLYKDNPKFQEKVATMKEQENPKKGDSEKQDNLLESEEDNFKELENDWSEESSEAPPVLEDFIDAVFEEEEHAFDNAIEEEEEETKGEGDGPQFSTVEKTDSWSSSSDDEEDEAIDLTSSSTSESKPGVETRIELEGAGSDDDEDDGSEETSEQPEWFRPRRKTPAPKAIDPILAQSPPLSPPPPPLPLSEPPAPAAISLRDPPQIQVVQEAVAPLPPPVHSIQAPPQASSETKSKAETVEQGPLPKVTGSSLKQEEGNTSIWLTGALVVVGVCATLGFGYYLGSRNSPKKL